MEKETSHPKLKVVKNEELPRALIFGGPDFLVKKLSERLVLGGCQVVEEEKERPDYVFILLTKDFEKLLLKIEEWRSRFILIFPLSQKIPEKIEEKISSLGGRILKTGPLFKDTAGLLVDQILQKMFQQGREKTSFLPFVSPKRKSPFIRFFLILIIFLLVLGVPLLPMAHFSFNFYKGYLGAKEAREKIQRGAILEGKEEFLKSRSFILESDKTLEPTKFILKLFGQRDFSYNLERISSVFHSFLSVGEQVLTTQSLIEDLGRAITQGNELTEEQLTKLQAQLIFLEKELSFSISQIKSVDPKKLPVGKEELGNVREEVEKYRSDVQFGNKLLSIFPEVGGLNGPRTYLLLFQNNMELRPTGGFIGSYGLLTVEKGKIVDFKIEDIYTADGQLKGHVSPPEPIRKFLSQPHWFLRDSNWDPDFSQTALKAQWFLDKEIKVKVDGVIALDLFFVKEMIGAMGEIYLPDYEVSLTQDNFFFQTQEFSQRDFFPGSTQKKDFLGSLGRQIFLRLEGGKELPAASLLTATKESLEEKHLQIFLNDSRSQQKIEGLGWAGRQKNVKCQMSNVNCLEDYLMIVEANLGVNKANYFVSREIEKEVNFGQDGEIRTKLTIIYENDSPNDNFPAGVYKNYLRVYLSQEVNLEKVFIDDQEVEMGEVDKEEGGGKKIYGIFLEVPISSRKKIVFESKLPGNENPQVYQLLVQKQAGTASDPFLLRISYPREWQPLEANFSPVKKDGSLIYQSDTKVDRIFRIKFKTP